MFEIFHLQSNAGLKASTNAYNNYHFTKFEFRMAGKEIFKKSNKSGHLVVLPQL